MRNRFVFLLSLLLMVSCFSDKDFDFSEVSLSPELAFPVAFGDIGLLNLLSNKDSSYVKSYPDGSLYFQYSQTLASREVRELFCLPDNHTTTSFSLPAGSLAANSSNVSFGTINRQIDLNLSPEQLTEILLKAGTLRYSVSLSMGTTPPNLPIEAVITLNDVIQKTTQQPLVFTAAMGSGTKQLEDHVINTTNNRFYISIELIIKPHPTTFIPAGTNANVELSFDGMDFSYIKGFLGDQITPLPPQSMDITVFGSSLHDGTATFVQPLLTLTVVNDYGAPCEVSFSTLQAKKGDASLPLQLTPSGPVNINSPTTLGMSATTPVNITNQQAIFSFGPERLEYTATARINKGLSNASNFLADTSKLSVILNAEIPVYGKSLGVIVTDTLHIDLESLSGSTVSSSSLKISGRNDMPLDANLQIYLADSARHVTDSLFSLNQTYVVKASTVDASGELLATGLSDFQLGLETAKFNKLFKSKYLIIKATLSTARDANGTLLNVKFKSSYRLKLNIGLRARFKITSK